MRVDCTGLENVDDCIHINDVLHVRSLAQLSYEEAVEVVYAHLDAGSSADAAAAALVQVCNARMPVPIPSVVGTLDIFCCFDTMMAFSRVLYRLSRSRLRALFLSFLWLLFFPDMGRFRTKKRNLSGPCKTMCQCWSWWVCSDRTCLRVNSRAIGFSVHDWCT